MNKILTTTFLLLILAAAGFPQTSTPQFPFLGSLPSAPKCIKVGQVYFDTTSAQYKYCTTVGTPGTFTGMGSPTIGALVSGATKGSVLFGGTGGALAQNNSRFYFIDTLSSSEDGNGKLMLWNNGYRNAAGYNCVFCLGDNHPQFNGNSVFRDIGLENNPADQPGFGGSVGPVGKWFVDIEPTITANNDVDAAGVQSVVTGRATGASTFTGVAGGATSYGNGLNGYNGQITLKGVQGFAYVRSQNEPAAYGGYFQAFTGGNPGLTNTTPLYGVFASVAGGHNGTTPLQVGGYFKSYNLGGGTLGTITKSIGVQSVFDGSGSTTHFGTTYGFSCESWVAAAGGWDTSACIYADNTIDRGTNKYFIYSLSSSPSFFSGMLQTQLATEQLRLGYDSSHYFSSTVASTGSTTFALTGSGTPQFNFSNKAVFNGGAFAASSNPYDATGWDGSLRYTTENDVRDVLVTLVGGLCGAGCVDTTSAQTVSGTKTFSTQVVTPIVNALPASGGAGGNDLELNASNASSGTGGYAYLSAGNGAGGAGNGGGAVFVYGGTGDTGGGTGGDIWLNAGGGGTGGGSGGSVVIAPGLKNTTGTSGTIKFKVPSVFRFGSFDLTALSADRTYSLQDTTGTLATVQDLNANYSNSFSGVGTTAKTIVVSKDVTVSSSVTVSPNVKIKVVDGAKITVASGQTLTIGKFEDPGDVDVFDGSGKVTFSAGAIDYVKVAWWAGTTAGTDITSALTDASLAITNMGGGEIRVPTGSFTSTGGISLPRSALLVGNGKVASTITLTGTSTALFSVTGAAVGSNERRIGIEKIGLAASTKTSTTLVDIYGSNAAGAGFYYRFDQVGFSNASIGVNVRDTVPDGWETEFVTFDTCYWYQNTVGYRMNSINNSIRFNNPYFDVPASGTGLDLQSFGSVLIYGHLYTGPGGTEGANPWDGFTNGATFIQLTNDWNNLYIVGGQDEGGQYFLKSTNPNDPGKIVIENTLIQSIVQATGNLTVNSKNNTHPAYVFQDSVGGRMVLHSEGDSAMGTDLNNDACASCPMYRFTNAQSLVANSEPQNDVQRTFGDYTEFTLQSALLGLTTSQTPAFASTTRPIVAVKGTNGVTTPYLQMCDQSGSDCFGYQMFRDQTAGNDLGFLNFRGNQSGFTGYKFDSKIVFERTVTAAGTTGNQTINKAAGTVNVAGGASSLTVTNSLVKTDSIVLAVARTNDATCYVKSVVPAAGSFVVNMTAACTGETSVGFVVH